MALWQEPERQSFCQVFTSPAYLNGLYIHYDVLIVSLVGPVSEMLSGLHITNEIKKWFTLDPEDEKDSVRRFTSVPIFCNGALPAEN